MTPRTACTAVGELLCERYGGEFLPAEDILDCNGFISVQKKHSTLAELVGHGILAAKEAKSLLKVATVRNPYDSLVSLYFKQCSKYQPLLEDPCSWVNRSPHYAEYMRYAKTHSFNQWLLRVSYRKIIKRFLGLRPSMYADYTRGANVVMRYERLEQDLAKVFAKAGIDGKATIPAVNRTEERDNISYRSCYSRAGRLAASVAYGRDLKQYDYAF
jgi:hypothetical protein